MGRSSTDVSTVAKEPTGLKKWRTGNDGMDRGEGEVRVCTPTDQDYDHALRAHLVAKELWLDMPQMRPSVEPDSGPVHQVQRPCHNDKPWGNAMKTNGLGLVGWLTIIFVVAKIFHLIDWPWIWVFAPVYVTLAVIGVILAVILVASLLRAMSGGTW